MTPSKNGDGHSRDFEFISREQAEYKKKVAEYLHGNIELEQVRESLGLTQVQRENLRNAKSLSDQAQDIVMKLFNQLEESN